MHEGEFITYLLQAVLVDSDKVECVVQEVKLECAEHGDREFDAEVIDAKPRSAVRHRRDHLGIVNGNKFMHTTHVFFIQCVGPLKALYTSSPGRPVHSDTNFISLGSILAS